MRQPSYEYSRDSINPPQGNESERSKVGAAGVRSPLEPLYPTPLEGLNLRPPLYPRAIYHTIAVKLMKRHLLSLIHIDSGVGRARV